MERGTKRRERNMERDEIVIRVEKVMF